MKTEKEVNDEAAQMWSLFIQIAVIATLADTCGQFLEEMLDAKKGIRDKGNMPELSVDHIAVLHEQLQQQVADMRASTMKCWPHPLSQMLGNTIGESVCNKLLEGLLIRKATELSGLMGAGK